MNAERKSLGEPLEGRLNLTGGIKRVTGQRSNTIVLDYVAEATLDDDPPLLEIMR